MRHYDQTSFMALKQVLMANSGEAIATYPLAFITDRPRADGSAFFRQHAAWTGSDTILITQAFAVTSNANLALKVYWNALVPRAAGIELQTLDKRRPGHHIAPWEVGSHEWLVTSSVMLPPASAVVACGSALGVVPTPADGVARAPHVGSGRPTADYFAQNSSSPSSPMGWTVTSSSAGA